MPTRFKRHMTIPEFLARSVQQHGRRVAVRVPVTRGGVQQFQDATYRELWDLSGKLAAWLAGQGIGAGDRVGLISKPSVGWAVAFFAVQRLGAVVVPMDAGLQPGEVARLLTECEAKLLFCSPQRYHEFTPLTQSVPTLNEVISVDVALGAVSLWDVLPDREVAVPDAHPDCEDLAVLMYTSGTTDDAKGVMLCHRNITSDIEAFLKVVEFTSEDSLVTIVPWYHIYGLTTTLLAPLWVGATVTYTDDYRNLIALARRVGVTVLVGVPKLYHSLYRRILENIEGNTARRILHRFVPRLVGKLLKDKLLGPQFRFFVSGGAPLAADVGAGLRRLGMGMIEGYGLTETAPVLTMSDPFTPIPGNVGRPLPGVKVKVDKPDLEGYGEVIVWGPNVMLGYYKNPERTAEVLTPDGWFRTGDIGKLDVEGRLFLAGRKKNLIVLESGKKVHPEELEWEFLRIPEVEEVLVYEDRSRGEPMVAAMVYPNWQVLKKQGIETPDQAKARVWEAIRETQRNIAPFKRLRDKDCIKIVDQPFEKSTKQDIKRHLYVRA
ncbi:MAG: long-chain fatty acid--CoA ligase [Candidatus Bipolaricaulis sp.]|jgi:long-chain acyl-CoA synthetase|uniref:Putative AMP-forming long-chain acyl-CoA synthetase,faD n=1 Tax=Candidatus Bipolaricaulis anaerobius TaxID=2026885 RepID=A0A2X3MJ17_9BACT|nr:AMP-binding protein [Candidatus Bipolaricaulis anaerobius]SQD92135.1 putative AMP-forming long-chain acyl-CoA synthetase,faD [Candidatus Bipolaricaulis anaerobius]